MVDKLEAAEMAAFGASEAACYFYPGEHQQPERAAFCEGAAHAVSTPANGEQVERVARALADRFIERGKARVSGSWYASYDDMPGSYRNDFLDDARAAIAASTPTEDARSRVKVLEEAAKVCNRLADEADRAVSSSSPGAIRTSTMGEAVGLRAAAKAILTLGNKETDRHG